MNQIEFGRIKRIYSDWDAVYTQKGWGTIYLGNHDQPRMVSRWGNDSAEFILKNANYILLSMKGTPYYYYEIGMTNAKFDNVEDYRDIETLAEYERLQNTGDLKQFIEDQKTAREITGERLFNGTTLKTEGFLLLNPG
jgi:oligo-1,6-glucosidase